MWFYVEKVFNNIDYKILIHLDSEQSSAVYY